MQLYRIIVMFIAVVFSAVQHRRKKMNQLNLGVTIILTVFLGLG